jgi:sugar-specific transcriptional regulator TrmB
MVDERWIPQLKTLGLNKYEARAYLALLGHDESSAVEVANRASIPRQRIYDVLANLRDWDMVIAKDGRPVRHTARDPAIALPSMLEIRRNRQKAEHEQLMGLVETIIYDLEPPSNVSGSDGRPGEQIRSEQRKLSGGL